MANYWSSCITLSLYYTILCGNVAVLDKIEKYGGESMAEWSSWGHWSACSRTCGTGIHHRIRECHYKGKKIDKDDQMPTTCLGMYKQHKICNTEPCAVEADMRKEQCSKYDGMLIRGKRYRWEPYSIEQKPCELTCKPIGHRFYSRLAKTVVDGTKCGKGDSAGICVAGNCMTVGCDGVVGSDAKEDKCGVCEGDNSSCHIVSGIFTRGDLKYGYNKITSLPRGACNVNITEMYPSRNYLALKYKHGKYIINGNYALGHSKDYEAAGTKFKYHRPLPGDTDTKESIIAAGPTNTTLDIMVRNMEDPQIINQDVNRGILYEYTIPMKDHHHHHKKTNSLTAVSGSRTGHSDVSYQSDDTDTQTDRRSYAYGSQRSDPNSNSDYLEYLRARQYPGAGTETQSRRRSSQSYFQGTGSRDRAGSFTANVDQALVLENARQRSTFDRNENEESQNYRNSYSQNRGTNPQNYRGSERRDNGQSRPSSTYYNGQGSGSQANNRFSSLREAQSQSRGLYDSGTQSNRGGNQQQSNRRNSQSNSRNSQTSTRNSEGNTRTNTETSNQGGNTNSEDSSTTQRHRLRHSGHRNNRQSREQVERGTNPSTAGVPNEQRGQERRLVDTRDPNYGRDRRYYPNYVIQQQPRPIQPNRQTGPYVYPAPQYIPPGVPQSIPGPYRPGIQPPQQMPHYGPQPLTNTYRGGGGLIQPLPAPPVQPNYQQGVYGPSGQIQYQRPNNLGYQALQSGYTGQQSPYVVRDSEAYRNQDYNQYYYQQFRASQTRLQNDQIPDVPQLSDRSSVNLGILDKSAEYSWRIAGFTECSQSCGGGTQQTRIACVLVNTQAEVTAENCDNAVKPEPQTVACSNGPCPAGWDPSEWSECSTSCDPGKQTRTLSCRQRISEAVTLELPAHSCRHLPRPDTNQLCNGEKPCVRWRIGEWGKCTAECGRGQRSREVVCINYLEKIIPENSCREPKPPVVEICDMGSCAKTWFFTQWSPECSSECGEGKISRKIFCNAEVDKCRAMHPPDEVKSCKSEIPCGGKWFAGPWGKCTVTCGLGVVQRDVVCVKKFAPTILTVVNDDNCDIDEKPATEEPCDRVPCKEEWYMTDWTECSRSCDTGYQTREVKCLDINQQSSANCNANDRPEARRTCGTIPCHSRLSASACTDKLSNCELVAQARLCQYTIYKENCCAACRRHQEHHDHGKR